MRWPLLFLWVAACLLSEHLGAQPDEAAFEVITTDHGLPSNTVLSATRDHEGFMWFGTRACPVRYDGKSFRSYKQAETNFVSGLAPDQNNNVWFASDLGGVGWIDSRNHRLTTLPDTQHRGQTGDLYLDRRGFIWYADMQGVNKFDAVTGTVKHYPFPPNAYVWVKASFTEDSAHTLWVISRDNGLYKYDTGSDSLVAVWGPWAERKMDGGLIVMLNAVAEGDERLWMSTSNAGLVMYDIKTGNHRSYFPDPARQVTAVASGIDERGNFVLWVGTRNGLGTFDPRKETFHFFSNISDKPFSVNSIYCDRVTNIVWACTSSGIIKYHPGRNAIRTLRFPSTIPQNATAQVVIPDPDSSFDRYFIGLSGGGVAAWYPARNQFILYPLHQRMEVKWIVPGPDNKLVIGGNRWDYQRPGIFLLDPRSGAYSQSPMTRAANQKFSVPFFMYGAFDHNGNLLIGNSDEGIHVFSAKDGAEITPWNPETQLKLISHTNLINDMIVDRRGSLWLATHDGLYRADAATGTFTNSGQNHAVNAILEDRQGNIWAACWGAVIRLEGNGKLTPVLAASDGFFDREINGLAEDAHGNLWIGNYEGLYRYDPRSEKLMRFTTHDGLISNNTIGKVFVSENRKQIIVGQEGGLNIVDIEALNRDTPSSPIAITALKIDNTEHPVDYSKPLVLKRDQKVLSVDFAALNYRNDNRYAVRLEGFDKEWIDIGSNHQAYYTNLDPGSYTLRVKVANAFGGWNASMLEWDIHVRPAYYETWWFRIAIVAVIVMILYGLYRYRVRQLLHVQAVRNRISADLHDEFGSTLSGISIMGTLARQGLSLRESSDQLVERMLEDVAQMSGSLDDIVWNISPKNDSLSNLMARLTRYASELFEARNIRYSFNFPDRADHIKLAMEDRRNLYLILKESVNNLVKYSGCTEAHIAMKILPRTLQVTICDNGSGFDADAKNDRNGIKNMRERARQLKGSITIRSAPGKGTHITIDIPR